MPYIKMFNTLKKIHTSEKGCMLKRKLAIYHFNSMKWKGRVALQKTHHSFRRSQHCRVVTIGNMEADLLGFNCFAIPTCMTRGKSLNLYVLQFLHL